MIVSPTKVLPTILNFIACPILFPLIYKGAIEVPKLSDFGFFGLKAFQSREWPRQGHFQD